MVEISNQTKSRLNLSLVRKITVKFLIKYRLRRQQVSLVFIGDQRMRQLNKCYRRQDKITDVLSFREKDSSWARPEFLGEIIIDWQQIKRQARRLKHSQQEELIYILVHGLLHLAGYDDRTAKGAKEMLRLGEKFINVKCKSQNVK